MRFGDGSVEKSKLIGRYFKKADKINVLYLDGHIEKFDDCPEKEKEILNTMLDQAKTRNSNMDYRELERNKKRAFMNWLVGNIGLMISVFNSTKYKGSFFQVIWMFMAVWGAYISLGGLKDHFVFKIITSELKKYALYLDIHDKHMELCEKTDTEYTDTLNINDIDGISLKEMKFHHKKISAYYEAIELASRIREMLFRAVQEFENGEHTEDDDERNSGFRVFFIDPNELDIEEKIDDEDRSR